MKGKLIHKIYYYDDELEYLHNRDENSFQWLDPTIYRFQLKNTGFSLWMLDLNMVMDIPIEHLCHFSKYLGADIVVDFGQYLSLCKYV
uniref:Uncharacterized protein n=1 Tax=viral metagenome TaxID=1070528 RepID=A0A6C0CLY1_9ZZZZ